MENADKNIYDLAAYSDTTALTQPNISRIHRGNSGRRKSEKPCFRCDGKHSPDYCRFGMQLVTSTRKLATFQQPVWKRKVTKDAKNLRIREVDRDEHGDDTHTHTITSGDTASVHKHFRISRKKRLTLLIVLVGINNSWVEMEIDTGAAVSLINRCTIRTNLLEGPFYSVFHAKRNE